MLSFKEFFLEYRHHNFDGTPKLSPMASNKKGSSDIIKPNEINRKYISTKGPYKQINPNVSRMGHVFRGDDLTDVLLTYNLEFKPGKVSKIKNSPYGLDMRSTPQGNIAIVVKVK